MTLHCMKNKTKTLQPIFKVFHNLIPDFQTKTSRLSFTHLCLVIQHLSDLSPWVVSTKAASFDWKCFSLLSVKALIELQDLVQIFPFLKMPSNSFLISTSSLQHSPLYHKSYLSYSYNNGPRKGCVFFNCIVIKPYSHLFLIGPRTLLHPDSCSVRGSSNRSY